MKYLIEREHDGNVLAKSIKDDGSIRILPLYTEIVNHSPTGFNFGYGGSGPSQLALAVMMDYLNDKERALNLYHQFKFKFIAPAHGNSFEITEAQIKIFLEEQNAKSS